jgi:hypothetical protein
MIRRIDDHIHHEQSTHHGSSPDFLSIPRAIKPTLDRKDMPRTGAVGSAEESLLFHTPDTGTQEGRTEERSSNQ